MWAALSVSRAVSVGGVGGVHIYRFIHSWRLLRACHFVHTHKAEEQRRQDMVQVSEGLQGDGGQWPGPECLVSEVTAAQHEGPRVHLSSISEEGLVVLVV